MNRKITVREIAEHCGVSMATVSRAINGNSYVSPELRKKIREYLEDIGWEPRNLPGTRQNGLEPEVAVLASLELLSTDGKTVPTVCVNGIPAPSITHSTVLSWSDDTILTSPLLAAIAAYETGKRPPHWVQSYMRRSV